MVICVNFVARRFEKPRATEAYNDGQQNKKRRATKFTPTGNEILNNERLDFLLEQQIS